MIHRLPSWARFRKRVAELTGYPRRSAPIVRGGRRFETRNDGGPDPDALWVIDDRGPRVLVRPEEQGQAIGGFRPSPDGRFVAYTTTSGGSDWATARIVDVDPCVVLPDAVERLIPPVFAWLPDSSGFCLVYEPVAEADGGTITCQVKLHLRGETADAVVYEAPVGTGMVVPHVSRNGRHLLIELPSPGKSQVDTILHRPLDQSASSFEQVVTADAGSYLGVVGDVRYLQTHRDAPRGRVVAVDLADPARERWREVIPEGERELSLSTTSACACTGPVGHTSSRPHGHGRPDHHARRIRVLRRFAPGRNRSVSDQRHRGRLESVFRGRLVDAARRDRLP